MNAHLRRSAVLTPLAVLAIVTLAAAQDRVLTPDLILTVRQVADAQIAPDGSRVLLQVARPRTADATGRRLSGHRATIGGRGRLRHSP